MARGGKREGAGRKAKEATERMRIPVSLVNEVQALIAEQKEFQLNMHNEEFDRLIELLPNIQNDITSMTSLALMFDNWKALKGLPRNEKRIILKALK